MSEAPSENPVSQGSTDTYTNQTAKVLDVMAEELRVGGLRGDPDISREPCGGWASSMVGTSWSGCISPTKAVRCAPSLPSLISYLGAGEYRERYLGIRIPPTNIRDYQLQTARTFAQGLADRLVEPVGAN